MSSKTLYSSLFSGAALLCLLNSNVFAGQTTQISAPSNTLPNSAFNFPKMSADGRYITFSSDIIDNNFANIYTYNRLTKKKERIISAVRDMGLLLGKQAPVNSLSPDGRYVVFSNSLAKSTVNREGLYVYDRFTHKTEEIATGINFPSMEISIDGRYVAFSRYLTNSEGFEVSIYDRQTHKTKQINTAFMAHILSLSPDGHYVVFVSSAPNLVKGDINKTTDTFVYDQFQNKVERVSIDYTGKNGTGLSADISADGRYVAFIPRENALISQASSTAFVYDRSTHKTTQIHISPSIYPSSIRLSADGRYVGVGGIPDSSDKNSVAGIFIHDRSTHKTAFMSRTDDMLSIPAFELSADGRYVAFTSSYKLTHDDKDTNSDIFLRDRLLDTKHHTDLKITLTTKPITLKPNTQGNYLYTITNNGKDIVPDVSLIHLVSGGSAISFKLSQGKCSFSPVETVCHLGQLAAGKKLTLSVSVKAQSKSLSQQVTVSGAPVDANPGNNQVSITTPVK